MSTQNEWGLTERGFRRPTYTELLDALEYKARELFGSKANLTVRSPIGLFLRIFAWILNMLFSTIEDVYNSRFVDTAVGTSLYNLGKAIGLKLLSEQKSSGYLQITGTPGTIVPVGWLAGTVAGLQFVVMAQGEIGTGGTVLLPAQATTAGPEGNVAAGTVTVVIESVGGGDGGGPKFNINNLQPEGDPHFAEIWENILYWVGVPEDDQEYFLNSWLDWYDSDDVKKGDYGDNARDGSESEYYEDLAERNDEEKYKPRNGPIKDLKELAWVGAFRLHPAVLTGGWYYSLDERKEDDNIWITNTLDKVLGTFGGKKINVNLADKDVLLQIPGIRSPDDPEDLQDETMLDVVNAIIEWRNGVDMDGREVNLDDEENGTLIKDWSKLNEICQGYIKPEAQEYLAYQGGSGEGALYRVTIVAASMGMKHVVKAKMTIKDSRPVYLEWQEDP